MIAFICELKSLQVFVLRQWLTTLGTLGDSRLNFRSLSLRIIISKSSKNICNPQSPKQFYHFSEPQIGENLTYDDVNMTSLPSDKEPAVLFKRRVHLKPLIWLNLCISWIF